MVISMAKFLVTGTVKGGSKSGPFEKVVEAENEKMATQKALSLFGSNAGIKRSAIKIASVTKI